MSLTLKAEGGSVLTYSIFGYNYNVNKVLFRYLQKDSIVLCLRFSHNYLFCGGVEEEFFAMKVCSGTLNIK